MTTLRYTIGIDSTDSLQGGCTTWTISRLIDLLRQEDPSLKLFEFPHLVRLNPNIKLKTRGNASVAIFIETELNKDILHNLCRKHVESDYLLFNDEKGKFPGLVIIRGKSVNQNYYLKVLTEVVKSQAIAEPDQYEYRWPINSMGIIGALGATTADFTSDFTYELIAYRKEENFGKKRIFNGGLLPDIEEKFKLFSSYDYYEQRELIAPSGPDPIFCGIRSDSYRDLIRIIPLLQIEEDLDSFTIFKSNQGTGRHLLENRVTLEAEHVFTSLCTVLTNPLELSGGHVKFTLQLSNTAEAIDCMVFEPTKQLRNSARLLRKGDLIYANGSVNKNLKFGKFINLESFLLLDLHHKIHVNPACPTCKKTMKNAGAFKGFKCKRCDFHTYHRQKDVVSRKLFDGQRIVARLSAQRHLARPMRRLHVKNESTDTYCSIEVIRGTLANLT
ncbi:MAG: DUF1743 domain-containing protein [Candidatus Heimdallarchaeota archaeon]|nr:DUF1743 domain-containing protein [Candidatus Heimdallarchaeota archaeon]